MARDLLLRGMLAGLLAGFLAFAAASLFGEPDLERAIGFEAAMEHAAGHGAEDGPVSRATQRGVGLLTACVAIGVALGGLLAVAFAFAWQRVGRISAPALAAWLAAIGFVAVALVPQLKYPANPPAVGSDATIGLRTALYFEMVLIAVGALLLAVLLARAVAARREPWVAVLCGTAAFAALVVLLQFALPGVDEVPDGFPADVLWRFRFASLGIQFVLWAGIGAIFGVLARRSLRA
ncbi:MAG: CbtA family protein [Acetobacteraceae bacterium]